MFDRPAKSDSIISDAAATPLQQQRQWLQVPAGQRSTLGWLRTWSGRYSGGRHCGQPTAMQIIHVKSAQCIKGVPPTTHPAMPFAPGHCQWDIAYTPAKGDRMWSRS